VLGLGPPPERQPARLTELAVYLALHPSGVSTDKFATDLWPEDRQPSDSARRSDISRLRAWLGTDPRDAAPFLPTFGNRYQLTDRLLDSELFTRLTARAGRHIKHDNPGGALRDLSSALGLVRGPILPDATGPAYAWLANPDRMEDRVLPMQVIDAAHSATQLALRQGDLRVAEESARIARTVDPYSNIPLCDLIRIARTAHDDQTARLWANLVLELNDVDIPADLPAEARQLVQDALRGERRTAAAAGAAK
jgi:DNA-binding SARP family transcriptional activator